MVTHGLPKRPTWTVLAATAHVGDTSLTLAEPVNWQVGDEVAVASSSLLPHEYDTAVITGISEDRTVLTLDRPLAYT